MLFYEVRHFSPKGGLLYVKVCLWIFLLVKKQYMKKKSGSFSKKKMSKSVSGYSKIKKYKKNCMDHQAIRVGQNLTVPTTKKHFFLCVSSLILSEFLE